MKLSRKTHKPSDPMWVIGCIDAYGAISARVVKRNDDIMHTLNESKGKRWRWNIWSQEFHCTRNPTLDKLDPDERVSVESYLERRGLKDPD